MSNPLGTLYIVATPIGHLADITQRALSILNSVSVIAAEDTRHSSYLLKHYQIKTPLIAYHEHNESTRSPELVERLLKGDSIALISDAGTPLISDPGYRLVQLACQAGIAITPIPGPCALIAALSASGLATQGFVFDGFLPSKSTARQQHLRELSSETRSLVFYEAPHRILATIQDMLEIFGIERYAVIARELTKTFETIHGDKLGNLQAWLKNDHNQQRGEFVVIVAGAIPKDKADNSAEIERVLDLLLAELPLKQAASLAAKLLNMPKNLLYKLALAKSQGV